MCFARCCPDGWKVGGKSPTDFHVWVEDEEGNIYDPSFQEHKIYCRINNCEIDRPVYRPWGNQEHWFNDIYRDDFRKTMTKKDYRECNKQIKYTFLRCPTNSMKNYCKLKLIGKNPRVIIGSMGWERKDGTAHWEWG